MKKLEIVIRSYRRGILSRETFVFPAEELRREGRGVGEVRRALGVAESWLRGLRAMHYFLLRDGRVSGVISKKRRKKKMESIYNVAGSLLNRYINELSAVADENRLTTYELIAIERERQLTPRLTVSRERLAEESARRIPAGRL